MTRRASSELHPPRRGRTVARRDPAAHSPDANARGAVLRAEGIGADYGGAPVLEDVSLEIRPGEVHGLIGPNGAGKSTLLRILGGLVKPSAGAVTIEPEGGGPVPLRSLSSRERARRVAFLPQDTGADAGLTVETVVALGRFAHQTRFERLRAELGPGDARLVTAALERVGVAHLRDRLVTALSGGQRQLVLIAKQLAQGSTTLLLDEPVSALDLGYQIEVLELLRELAAEGRAVAVVLHDLNLAARCCDRLAVLERGRMRAAGPPEAVLEPALLDGLYGVRTAVDVDERTGAPRVTALARVR